MKSSCESFNPENPDSDNNRKPLPAGLPHSAGRLQLAAMGAGFRLVPLPDFGYRIL
jgi:hypothetical protein